MSTQIFTKQAAVEPGTLCTICRGTHNEGQVWAGHVWKKADAENPNDVTHSFHLDCIDSWFKEKKSCPICRATSKLEPSIFPERVTILGFETDVHTVKKVAACALAALMALLLILLFV